jgi:hypothetical protein
MSYRRVVPVAAKASSAVVAASRLPPVPMRTSELKLDDVTRVSGSRSLSSSRAAEKTDAFEVAHAAALIEEEMELLDALRGGAHHAEERQRHAALREEVAA